MANRNRQNRSFAEGWNLSGSNPRSRCYARNWNPRGNIAKNFERPRSAEDGARCRKLDAVRQARAVSEEESFCERGRENAVRLMQERQFAQAADLLRNLRSLFPCNAVLERDLITAQGALDQGSPKVTAATEEGNRQPRAPEIPTPPPPFTQRPESHIRPADGGSLLSRVRRAAIDRKSVG